MCKNFKKLKNQNEENKKTKIKDIKETKRKELKNKKSSCRFAARTWPHGLPTTYKYLEQLNQEALRV